MPQFNYSMYRCVASCPIPGNPIYCTESDMTCGVGESIILCINLAGNAGNTLLYSIYDELDII